MNNDFMNITSINYSENELNMKYFVDLNDIWWYCFKDICDYLELNENVSNSLYKHKLFDNEKQECLDNNNEYGDYIREKFICSDAVRKLIKRVNERTNKLIKTINNLELAVNAHDIYNDADELKARIELLNESLKIDDYEEIVYQSYEIANSKSGRDILDKAGIIDKDKEKLLDLIREDIYAYDDYIDEVEMTLITRKEDTIDTFKLCEFCRESTCPSWLRNCVK